MQSSENLHTKGGMHCSKPTRQLLIAASALASRGGRQRDARGLGALEINDKHAMMAVTISSMPTRSRAVVGWAEQPVGKVNNSPGNELVSGVYEVRGSGSNWAMPLTLALAVPGTQARHIVQRKWL